MPADHYYDPFAKHSELEQIAVFYLEQAFRYAHFAAEYEIAGEIFGERIMAIDPHPEFKPPPLSDSLSESLRAMADWAPDDPTIDRLAAAWRDAQDEAPRSRRRLRRESTLSSPDILAHAVLLSACVECVVNRHLFKLREDGMIDGGHFNSLDRVELLPKILFVFKSEVMSKKLSTSRLKQLIGVRNASVHYKEASVGSQLLAIDELLAIWQNVSQVLGLVQGDPSPAYIDDLAKGFKLRWVS
jgi:hypothetical protein